MSERQPRIMPTRVGLLHARFDNGTCWPLPTPDGHEPDTGHALRYGTQSLLDSGIKYHAASIVEAYAFLLRMPQRQLIRTVRALKEAMRVRESDALRSLADEIYKVVGKP